MYKIILKEIARYIRDLFILIVVGCGVISLSVLLHEPIKALLT